MNSQTENKKIVDVAAAVLQKPDGTFLLAQRPQDKIWAGYWEFPGGKIESGESARAALQRELHEELGIEVEQTYPWLTRRFDYPHAQVRLHFFRVMRWHGEPHGRENQQLSWQLPGAAAVSPLLPANAPILRALDLPPVYAITNVAELGEANFMRRLYAALENGLRLIQVREKKFAAPELERFAAAVTESAHAYGAKVIVNGDPALARAVGADGVQLSSAELMRLRERPSADLLYGASCHNAEELAQAAGLGLDFAVLSPVLPTLSHPGAPTLGWDTFAALVSDCPLPVYALGGVSASDRETAWQYGAHGVAMLRGAW